MTEPADLVEKALDLDEALVVDVTSVEEAALALAALPDPAVEVRLVVPDVHVLRLVGLAAIGGAAVGDLTVEVASHRRVTATWQGALGHLPGMVGAEIELPDGRRGVARVRVRLAAPLPLTDLVAAVVQVLIPAPRWRGAGSPHVALGPGVPARALALLPEAAARSPRVEPNPDVLLGNDLLLVRAGSTPDVQAARVLELSATGVVGDPSHAPRPIVDLRLHNAVGRSDLRASGTGDFGALVLSEADGRIDLVGADGTTRGIDVAHPLDAGAVQTLGAVHGLDLSAAVVPASPAMQAQLRERLVEIAATGAVLHDGAALVEALALDDAALAASLSRAGRPQPGADFLLRSVAQRRAAQRGYGGFFRLDAAVQAAGWSSMLPHVTALLVTNRPERVAEALGRLGRQSYPNLDVVVVMHGAPAPDLGSLDHAHRERISEVVELDASVPFGETLAVATRRASGDLVTKVDDDDLYGPEHVWDLVLAYLTSGAQVVGKQPEHVYLAALDVTVQRTFTTENYTEAVAGGTMLMSVADLAAVGGWRGVPRSVDRGLLRRVVESGGLVYATHGLGFVYVRHTEGHTWAADDAHFLRRSVEQWTGLNEALLEG